MLYPQSFQLCFRIYQQKVKKNKILEVNGSYQLLVYADDDNIPSEYINTTKKNIEVLLQDCREVGVQKNTEKTKYICMLGQQNAGQYNNLLIRNKPFANVAKSKYVVTTLKNKD
jgi:hypothetical protein